MQMVTVIRIASLVLVIASVGAGQERPQSATPEQMERDIKNLYAKDPAIRSKASDNLREIGGPVVPYLVRVLKDRQHPNNDAMLAAIKMLGELRAREAVPALISVIDFNTTGDPSAALMKVDSRVLEEYPSVAALVQIGPDAVPALKAELMLGCISKEEFLLRTLEMIGGTSAAKAVDEYVADLDRRLARAKQISQALSAR